MKFYLLTLFIFVFVNECYFEPITEHPELIKLKQILSNQLKNKENSPKKEISTRSEINTMTCGCDKLDKCPVKQEHKSINDKIQSTGILLTDMITSLFNHKKIEKKEEKITDQSVCNSKTSLKCNGDAKIKIINAEMSNKKNLMCKSKIQPLNENQLCNESVKTSNIVRNICDGKNSCELLMGRDFDNICDCISNVYLNLTYSCVVDSNDGLTSNDDQLKRFKRNSYNINVPFNQYRPPATALFPSHQSDVLPQLYLNRHYNTLFQAYGDDFYLRSNFGLGLKERKPRRPFVN